MRFDPSLRSSSLSWSHCDGNCSNRLRSSRRPSLVVLRLVVVVVSTILTATTSLLLSSSTRGFSPRTSLSSSSSSSSFQRVLSRVVRPTGRPFDVVVRTMSSSKQDDDDEKLPLSSRLAASLIERNRPPHDIRCAIAVAGGGATALSALVSTPGASSFLLEGVVAYDRRSFDAYVGEDLDPSVVREAKQSGGQQEERFSYSSDAAADLLARAALLRASRYADDGRRVGVGCASALATNAARRSTRGPACRVVVRGADGSVLRASCGLRPEASRRAQEEAVSAALLRALEGFARGRDDADATASLGTVDDVASASAVWGPVADARGNARRVAAGETRAALLRPDDEGDGWRPPPPDLALPRRSVVFPGSFNPIHRGHWELARAALRAVERRRDDDDDDDDVSPTLLFELSVTNPDKPPMAIDEVERRAGLIRTFMAEERRRNDDNDDHHHEWGLLLDSAPLFVEKVDALLGGGRRDGDVTYFVVGADTMVRILDPKYYEGGEAGVRSALRNMRDKGVRFVVGGRLEQGASSNDEPVFVDGAEARDRQPSDIRDMFHLVPEKDFRVDLSSTQIRNSGASSSTDHETTST